MIELRRDPFEPANCIVTIDGDWAGDVIACNDGTWRGDVTQGNGPPSRPFATQLEAVDYVVSGRTPVKVQAAKLPVHLGDLRGASGNMFMIIGALKRSIKDLDREGIPVSDEARDIVANYMTRTYDETIGLIAEHCDDLDGSLEAAYDDYDADPERDEDFWE